jgi:hypothetical protein
MMRSLHLSFILLLAATADAFVAPHTAARPVVQVPSSSTTKIFSEVPRMDDSSSEQDNDIGEKLQVLLNLDWKAYLPPPPEDQFILMGDISVLFIYAFTSHFLNNFVVESVLANSHSIQDALSTLDPMGEVVVAQNPVWVQPEMMDAVLTINAHQSLLDHWGPLYSTAGSACVALCSSWLLAGWMHRAFSFQNSLDCSTDWALQKTFETWISTAIIMCLLTLTSNAVVGHVPLLQEWLGCASCRENFLLTKADTMFVVDSATVLMTWRFLASTVVNMFR